MQTLEQKYNTTEAIYRSRHHRNYQEFGDKLRSFFGKVDNPLVEIHSLKQKHHYASVLYENFLDKTEYINEERAAALHSLLDAYGE